MSGGSKEGSRHGRWLGSLPTACPGQPPQPWQHPGLWAHACIQPCPGVPERWRLPSSLFGGKELVVALLLSEMPLPPLLRAPPGAKQGLAGIFPLA